jgi:hypothetical protein
LKVSVVSRELIEREFFRVEAGSERAERLASLLTRVTYGACAIRPDIRFSTCPCYHKVVGQAGKAIERGFCSNCGSQVTVKLERLPDILGLQAGSLVDPSIYRPAMDVFTVTRSRGII